MSTQDRQQRRRLSRSAALGAACAFTAAPMHADVLLGASPLLHDGALAMMVGDWARGVELTRLGLKSAATSSDRAAGLSNLCAAYTALKQFDVALENCDASLALDDRNWRTWQNRAAAHLGMHAEEAAVRDVLRGLELKPDAEELLKTLAIARQRQSVQSGVRSLIDT